MSKPDLSAVSFNELFEEMERRGFVAAIDSGNLSEWWIDTDQDGEPPSEGEAVAALREAGRNERMAGEVHWTIYTEATRIVLERRGKGGAK